MPNDLIEISSEVQAQKVIELMFQGCTKKAACEQSGVIVRTFDRWAASNPELIQQLQAHERAKFFEKVDEIQDNRLKNLDAMLEFSKVLRNNLAVDGLLDMDDARKNFASLLKLENQLAKTMQSVLPEVKDVQLKPPSEIDENRAAELLLKLNGANLITITKTIEVTQNGNSSISNSEIIEGIVSPAE